MYGQMSSGPNSAEKEVGTLRYYYIVSKDNKTALCFCTRRYAKCQAKEHNSLIYFSKKELPKTIENVKGACLDSKRTKQGNFSSSLDANKFDKGETK